MGTKRKILLLQWPASVGSDGYFFEQLGFEVMCEHIVSFDYLAEHVETLIETLNGYDFIVLGILSSPDFSEITFPLEKIEKLKMVVNNMARHQGRSISLIAMHMWIDKRLKSQQQSLFDELFIDVETPVEQIKKILHLD